jgi:type IV pilus assembly protein PilM
MSRGSSGFGAHVLASWLASPPPDAAVEIAPERVSAASMVSRGAGFALQSYAVEPLPAGVIVPSLADPNILDRDAVAAAVRSVLGRLSTRARRVALIIPDIAAKVSLVHFDHVPARRDDLYQLVRWQVRKSVPFAIDDACITYTAGARDADGRGEVVVVLARRNIVEEYEGVCAAAGAYAGLVDLATLAVLNLLLSGSSGPAGDWLVVHMRPEYTSIAILRERDVIFFRNRPEGSEETLADLVHQTAMYYQDRLDGQGFARVMLAGRGRTAGALDLARRSLEERLETVVEPVDPVGIASLSDRISVPADAIDTLTPLTGMLLRTRVEAVGV